MNAKHDSNSGMEDQALDDRSRLSGGGPQTVSRRQALKTLGAGGLAAAAFGATQLSEGAAPNDRPNILWILSEDMGPDVGCYGNRNVTTPTLDGLAADGIRFTNAFTASPVCSTSRSAMITGMYQATIDAHHHRSHRGENYPLPEPIRIVTDYFRDAGYYTANIRRIADDLRASGKTDFNFSVDKPFDGGDWDDLKPNQPFFAQINFSQPHRGGGWKGAREQAKKDDCLVDPAKVDLPPYYPDTPKVRDDWALYLDAIHLLDVNIRTVLDRLEADGMADNTIILFMGDHGRCHVRGKQWLYDAGIHVPMIVRWPGNFPAGEVREDVVSAIDIVPTLLTLAGIEPPHHLPGNVFLGPKRETRNLAFAQRDRCDETIETIRTARARRFHYIRNYRPDLPYMQPNRYKDTSYPTRNIMRELHAQGKLTPAQEQWMADEKPFEELYDVERDPHEIDNLAGSPEHRKILERLRKAHLEWMDESNDLGLIPEPILFELAHKYGHGYKILQHPDNRDLMRRIRAAIALWEKGEAAVPEFVETLNDERAPVRWWAATGLAWLGEDAKDAADSLRKRLDDPSPPVRVASARALGLMGMPDEALPVLTAGLKDENKITRHYAALALEHLGEDARPALDAIRAARKDSYDGVVRVANRIVDTLEG